MLRVSFAVHITMYYITIGMAAQHDGSTSIFLDGACESLQRLSKESSASLLPVRLPALMAHRYTNGK